MNPAGDASDGVRVEPVSELFGTETMAELFARQGRVDEAAAIYRQLLASRPDADRRESWTQRLAALAQTRPAPAPAPVVRPRTVLAPVSPVPGTPLTSALGAATAREALHMPMVVTQPVRSGQIIHASLSDLIVLAPVNPGAQLIADGNIHVYAPLRGRAFAGATGASDARIFCQKLEAELIAIDGSFFTFEDIPPNCRGKAVHIFLQNGKCVISLL